jgi:hypothetical protein
MSLFLAWQRNDAESFSWAELSSKGVILGDLREKDIPESLVCKFLVRKVASQGRNTYLSIL